jgi:hypothetical protein
LNSDSNNDDTIEEEFHLGEPAFKSSNTFEIPNLLRSNLFGVNASISSPLKVEKLRSYSHEIPDINHLVCLGCAKDMTLNSKEDICARCSKGLQKAREFASSFNGLAFIGPKCKTISFSCSRGHSWIASLAKATKSWCSVCRKEDREQKRRDLEDLSAKIETENIEKQQALFDEARL